MWSASSFILLQSPDIEWTTINHQSAELFCGWPWLLLPRSAALRRRVLSCGCVYACRNAANHINRLILAWIRRQTKVHLSHTLTRLSPPSNLDYNSLSASTSSSWVYAVSLPEMQKTTFLTGCTSCFSCADTGSRVNVMWVRLLLYKYLFINSKCSALHLQIWSFLLNHVSKYWGSKLVLDLEGSSLTTRPI